MRYMDLWERFMWQYLLTIVSFIMGELVPVGGLKIAFLGLMILSLLWAIQRILSYQLTPEEGRLPRLATLKLGYALVSIGLALVGVFLIIGQIIGTGRIYLFTSPMVYLLVLPGCGFLACAVGIILAISVLRTHGSTTQHNEEHY